MKVVREMATFAFADVSAMSWEMSKAPNAFPFEPNLVVAVQGSERGNIW
jgi:hypothetical protein